MFLHPRARHMQHRRCLLGPSSSAVNPHKFIQDEVRYTLMPSYRHSLAFPFYWTSAFAEACRDVAKIRFWRVPLPLVILDHHEIYHPSGLKDMQGVPNFYSNL